METRSLIDGQTVQDGNGHGTHCAGIACGPLKPEAAPRYGVAGDALLYAGKVLSDEGSGPIIFRPFLTPPTARRSWRWRLFTSRCRLLPFPGAAVGAGGGRCFLRGRALGVCPPG